MDLELSGFYQRLEKINIVFEKATITIIFLGLVVGLTVWFMRRAVLNEVDNYAQLNRKVNYIQQKKDWYIGATQSSMQLANLDHVEAMMNTINRLIPADTAFQVSHKSSGKQERLRRYS